MCMSMNVCVCISVCDYFPACFQRIFELVCLSKTEQKVSHLIIKQNKDYGKHAEVDALRFFKVVFLINEYALNTLNMCRKFGSFLKVKTLKQTLWLPHLCFGKNELIS